MEVFERISNLLINGEQAEIETLIKELLKQNTNPLDIIEKGLTPGMKAVGDKFEERELFLPEMMLAADTMKASVDLLRPYIPEQEDIAKKGTVVIGTIEGDVHDIGKNIVSVLLEVSGFEVHDLGRDVSAAKFVDTAQQLKASIIAVSTLMTTTMTEVPQVIEELNKRGLRNKHFVLVGGAPVTEGWAKEIGADGTAKDAVEAVKVAERLMQQAV